MSEPHICICGYCNPQAYHDVCKFEARCLAAEERAERLEAAAAWAAVELRKMAARYYQSDKARLRALADQIDEVLARAALEDKPDE